MFTTLGLRYQMLRHPRRRPRRVVVGGGKAVGRHRHPCPSHSQLPYRRRATLYQLIAIASSPRVHFLERRSCHVCALIVTPNNPFGRWAEGFDDDVVAAAVIDRLVHRAEVITLKGGSARPGKRQIREPKTVAGENGADNGHVQAASRSAPQPPTARRRP